jgi:hypothetical protein
MTTRLKATYIWKDGYSVTHCHPQIPRGLVRKNTRPSLIEFSREPETPEEKLWITRCNLGLSRDEPMGLVASFYNDDGGLLQKPCYPDYDIRCDKQTINFLPITVGFNRPPETEEEYNWCEKCRSMCNEPTPVSHSTSTSGPSLCSESPGKAKSDVLGLGLVLIPFHSIYRIGKIFIEGLRYGRDNWRKGIYDSTWQEERLEHAINHLFLHKEGDRSEDHLAKVAWFCVVQMELLRLEEEGLKNEE